MRPRSAGKQQENEPVKLNRVVRGELDWIVMKAMEKNRNRRYTTPNEFAHDVQCYLDGEPVTACPPSTAYRFQKFARRHRLALSVSALVAACLLLGLVGTSLQAFRAMRAEKRALAEMDLKELARQEALTSAEQARAAAAAERRAREAEQLQRQKAEAASVVAANEAAMAKAISQFLQRDLLGLAGAETQLAAGMEIDPDVKLATLLKRALDGVDERFADQPRIRIQIMATLSRSFESIGQYAEAAQLLEEISEFLKLNYSGEHPETLRIENNLAALYIYQERLHDAEPLLKKTLQVRRRLKGNEHAETLASMSNLAVLYKMQGRFEEAEPLYRECLETERRKLGDDHEETAKTMGNLALLYQEMSRLDDAERLFTEALEVNRRVLPPTHPKIAVALSNLGVLYRKRDRHEDAFAVLSEAVEIQERACGPEHPDTITTKANLASLYKAQGRYDLAEPIFTDALERLRRKLGNDHSRTRSQLNNLGLLYMEQERFDEAMPLLVEVLETGRRVLSSKHPDTLLYVSNLGVLLRRSGRLEESLALHEEAWRLRKEVLGPDHVDTIASMANLGLTYLDAGNAAEGIRLLEEVRVTSKKAAEFGWIRTKLADAYAKDGKIPQAIDLIVEQISDARKSSAIDRQRFANILASCGFRLLKLEAWQEAEPVLRESLALREELSPGTWATFSARSMLGEALLGQQRYTQAEPLLLDGHAGLIQQVDSSPQQFDSRVRLAVERLIRLYEATKNAEEAEKWKAELKERKEEEKDTHAPQEGRKV